MKHTQTWDITNCSNQNILYGHEVIIWETKAKVNTSASTLKAHVQALNFTNFGLPLALI